MDARDYDDQAQIEKEQEHKKLKDGIKYIQECALWIYPDRACELIIKKCEELLNDETNRP